MEKILIGGAGGAPSENVIRSLAEGMPETDIIGCGSEVGDLMLSSAKKKYLVPYAMQAGYWDRMKTILIEEKPDLIHFQNDIEIREVSRLREQFLETGVKLFMPSKETIEVCVDKGRSAEVWERAGLPIPKTMRIHNETDLINAFDKLGNPEGKIWLRATEGGGGKGALPADNYDFAKLWIERFRGWGEFTAAELLSSKTVTWLSIWFEGELVVAQTRGRRAWNFGNRTLSGVTGITQIGETCSDNLVTETAINSIRSIDSRPHGIYGVDMTYSFDGIPNLTEINISRFFTTVYFFTAAGLNMPKIFTETALQGQPPTLSKKINPLPDGLLWIRSMDRQPMLTNDIEIKNTILGLKE